MLKEWCGDGGVGPLLEEREGGGGGSDRVNDMNGGIQEDGGRRGGREGGGLHNLKDRRHSLLYVLNPSR